MRNHSPRSTGAAGLGVSLRAIVAAPTEEAATGASGRGPATPMMALGQNLWNGWTPVRFAGWTNVRPLIRSRRWRVTIDTSADEIERISRCEPYRTVVDALQCPRSVKTLTAMTLAMRCGRGILVNALLSDLLVTLRLTQAVPYQFTRTAFSVPVKPSVPPSRSTPRWPPPIRVGRTPGRAP